MLKRIKSFFAPRIIYKIVEVKAPRPAYTWDQNTRDAVSTLSAHPGFIAITDRLALTKAQLESTNNRSVKKDLREADFLQAGIFWSGWLQEQVEKATTRGSSRKFVDPYDEELAAFRELDARIERVGE